MRNIVTKEYIDSIVENTNFEILTKGGKTTIVIATLPNGFMLVESSGCVDPTNYDEQIGYEICRRKIIDRIWLLEGYVLQNELKGIK